MSLLDEARHIEKGFRTGPVCSVCSVQGRWHPEGDCEWSIDHRNGCPALTMPRIVAALEAAEDAVADWEETRDGVPDYGAMSALRLALKRANASDVVPTPHRLTGTTSEA